MVKNARSFLSVLVLFSVFSFSLSAQSSSASAANRRTAVRYLQLAKQSASERLWEEVLSSAQMGLAYDDKIADLWYIQAAAQSALGGKKSRILPLVVTALTESEWVDYNRDGARILYADILCTTRQFSQSLDVLDSEPFIHSADAEYIRAKNYYSLGDDESVSKARSRIDSARRVYPADPRFAELFYTREYQLLRKGNAVGGETRRLADAFALTVPLYKNASAELEIYAAIFAGDEDKKTRMLKAFDSKGRASPLYAVETLRSNLLDEDSALDYFYQFSDRTIPLSVLEDFASLLRGDEARTEFSEYLNSYSGTVTVDTDGDLITNMTVVYRRGRPESISYDENQDDESEWQAVCDFGVPLSLTMAENALELSYSRWPYISGASYRIGRESPAWHFTLIAETLAWSPFTVEADPSIKASLGSDFFIPVISDMNAPPVSGQDLLRAALSYTIPSSEREGAVIQVSLLNGTAQLASYSVGERIYAMAQFEDGIPVLRTVDVDGDGLFETTEYYGYSRDPEANFISAGDELQIMTNLFGSPGSGSGFYVKKITVDRNGDTIADFTEEYLPAGGEDKIPGKISSWDTDADGEWDVQYIKYPSMIDGKLREEARFHQPLTDSIVSVTSEDGVPVFVQNGSDVLSVTRGRSEHFYWISDGAGQEDEEEIIRAVDRTSEQGVSMIVESGSGQNKRRFLAVRIEKCIFGMEIPDENLPALVDGSGRK